MKKATLLFVILFIAISLSVIQQSSIDENIVSTSNLNVVDSQEESPTPTIALTPTEEPVSPYPETDIKVDKYVSFSLSGFIYPNSNIKSQSKSSIVIDTADDTKTVTDWYKNKIKLEDMNVTSFVSINSNDNVLNKLSGANSSNNLEVTITRNSSDLVTLIEVVSK